MSRKGRGNRKNRRSSTNRINTSGKKSVETILLIDQSHKRQSE